MTEEINKAIAALQEGELIIYPTEIGWVIGCDATNEVAVQKIVVLKKAQPGGLMESLVANDAMLEKYVEKVPDLAYDLMDLSTKPTTIIYDHPKGIATSLLYQKRYFPVRVAMDKFCQYLINKFKKPLVAIPANTGSANAPKRIEDIPQAILKDVAYVVNLQKENNAHKQTSIIKLGSDGIVRIIRE